MIRKNINLDDISTETLDIGFVGEANHVEIAIHCAGFFKEYPDATAMMTVAPPVGEMYPVQLDRDDQALIWEISEGDLAYAGAGTYQLTFTEDEEIIKTVYGNYSVSPSLVPTGDPPDPIENWIERAEEALAAFDQDVSDAEAWAAGTRDGEPVPSTDPAYENNSKYYAEEAAEIAASIPEDYSELSADVEEMKSSKAPVIINTASGDIAILPDGASGMPVKTLTVQIDPVQDLHGYESPWPAGGGKNKVPKGANGTMSDITYTIQENGEVIVTGTATATSFWGVQFTIPAGTYILNGCPQGGGSSTYLLDIRNAVGGSGISGINGDTGNGSTFTISEELTAYLNIRIASGYSAPSSGLKLSPMIRLSSVSDATFAPYENNCPISGWTGANVSRTGKNLIDKSGLQIGVLDASGNEIENNGGRRSDYIPVNGSNITYSNSYSGDTNRTVFCCYDENKNFIRRELSGNATVGNPFAFTFSISDVAFIRLSVAYNNISNSLSNIQAEYGSTATEYETFGSTAEYEFPQEAKPVYGAKMSIWQDGSGELVVDRVTFTEDGSSNINASNNNRFYINCNDARVIDATNQTTDRSVICDRLASTTWAGLATFNVSCAPVYGKGVAFRNDAITTAQGWKDYFTQNPTQFSYALATPVTYQLTNQQVIELLKGSNNIWADTGDVAVEYPADTKLYIDGKVAQLQALILENISNS